VSTLASLVAANVATVGASLSHVHVPGRAIDHDELNGNDEIEIGMGIHNEEGFDRVQTDLPSLIKALLKQLLDITDPDRSFINVKSGDPIALMVNNLGGLSNLELGAVTMEVFTQLSESYGIHPKRVLSGAYMTSLNGIGFSITILKIVDDRFLGLLDATTEAVGWLPPAPAENWMKTKAGAMKDANETTADISSSSSNLRGECGNKIVRT
jgi:dihydroxyacetone kinase